MGGAGESIRRDGTLGSAWGKGAGGIAILMVSLELYW